MSVQKVNVLVPPLRPVPPGAAWAASVVGWVFGSDPRYPSGLRLWAAAAKARLGRGRPEAQAARVPRIAAEYPADDVRGPGRAGRHGALRRNEDIDVLHGHEVLLRQ